MTTRIALLRGINVGGNPLSMHRLRSLCADLGFQNVQTCIQSGNILFDSPAPVSQFIAALETKLARESRLPIAILLRTAAQWSRLVAANPFLRQKGIDPARLHVTFLPAIPATAARKALAALDPGPDSCQLIGSEIYLHCPFGYGKTRLSNTAFEKLLHQKATTRNWNTILKLHTMALS